MNRIKKTNHLFESIASIQGCLNVFHEAEKEKGEMFSQIIDYINNIPEALTPDHKKGLYGYYIALFAYFMPSHITELSFKNLDGHTSSYTVTRINTAPQVLQRLSPYNVIALTPINSQDPSIICCPGTLPWSYDGFEITQLANVFPTLSPGRLSISYLDTLHAWATNQRKINIYGHSQGGGNCLALAATLENVKYACAINPSLPQTRTECSADVDIYINQHDWVALLKGYAPRDAQVHYLSASRETRWSVSQAFLAHINFPTAIDTVIDTETGEETNKKNHPLFGIFLYSTRVFLSAFITPIMGISVICRHIYQFAKAYTPTTTPEMTSLTDIFEPRLNLTCKSQNATRQSSIMKALGMK